MGRRGFSATPAVQAPAESQTGPDPRAAARSWLPAAVCACYLAAAVVLTWRLWAHPSSATVAGNPLDTSQFAWFMRYEANAIAHGRLPALVTTAMNAPRGINMMWNTTVLLPGILLTPVTLLAGPQVSLTVLLTLGFAGSAASMFYVLRRYGASLAAATVGGGVYGFSPALTHAAVGHYQLQFAVLPPLIVDAVLRLCLGTRRPLLTGAWLGVLVAAQVFVGEEMLFEAALAALLVIVVLAVSRPRAVLGRAVRVATGLGVAVVVGLALTGWALWTQLHGPLTQHGTAFYLDFYKNDLAGFITPDAFQLIHTSSSAATAARYSGLAPEYVAYLGIPLIVVLVVASVLFWRHLPVRACAVATAVLLLLSLGAHPLLSVTANPLAQRPGGITLPWGWIEQLPVVSASLPNRLSIVADGTAAAVLAFAIDLAFARLRRTSLGRGTRGAIRAGAIVAVVAAAAIAPLIPRPLSATPAVALPAGWDATLSALRLPVGARLLIVPVPTAILDDGLRWQADGGQRVSLIGGYFEGPDSTGRAFIDGPGFPELAWYLDYRWVRGQAWPYSPPQQPDNQAIAATLRYWRPQAVVADVASQPALERYLIGIFGRPATRYGSLVGWRT
jgi:hypothetical protein